MFGSCSNRDLVVRCVHVQGLQRYDIWEGDDWSLTFRYGDPGGSLYQQTDVQTVPHCEALRGVRASP